MQVPDFWPRLYLDTGDLLDIADGRTDSNVVLDLIAACEKHVVWLVVSSDHLQDALMPDEYISVDSLGTALEQFRFRALVTTGPHVVEPWSEHGVARDIVIEGCSNIREILAHSAGTSELASMRDVQDALYQAAVSSKIARQVIGEAPIARHHRAIALEATITQVLGWMGSDPVPVVLRHLEEDGGTPTVQEAVNLIRGQLPVAEVLQAVAPVIDAHGIDRTDLARRMAFSMSSDGFKVAPGAWLGGKLQAGLARNFSRKPRRSDVVDCFHAMHLPYVDIASCDGQSYTILSRLVEQARGPRQQTVSLFRNGRLEDIVRHIRALPTGADLARRVASRCQPPIPLSET
jgi:hypothetical protein